MHRVALGFDQFFGSSAMPASVLGGPSRQEEAVKSAGSSPNLTYTKISALDAIRIL